MADEQQTSARSESAALIDHHRELARRARAMGSAADAALHDRFVATVEGLSAVKDIRTLSVQPGDTVVVTTLTPMSAESCKLVGELVLAAFPGARVFVQDATLKEIRALTVKP